MNTTTLIAVTPGAIGGQRTQLVDARLLHDFLGVGKDFTNWIKLRIRQYGFEQNQDYLLAQTGEQLPSGTKWRSDYMLTLDMAKELAMVERTPKGRQARRYFIDCEKALGARHSSAVPAHPSVQPEVALAIDLHTASVQAINRQAQADVAGENAQRFHARREELLRLQRYLRLYGCLPPKTQRVGGGR